MNSFSKLFVLTRTKFFKELKSVEADTEKHSHSKRMGYKKILGITIASPWTLILFSHELGCKNSKVSGVYTSVKVFWPGNKKFPDFLFVHYHHYCNGPSCTSTKLCCVLQNHQNFQMLHEIPYFGRGRKMSYQKSAKKNKNRVTL